jgi:predicted metal-dependent phosphoesterase TrpH
MSPGEIVEAAVCNNVGLLAVADHDTIEGSRALEPLCGIKGIHFIPAVEIDTLENGVNFHVLAYGFSFDDSDFTSFIRHMRRLLDDSNIPLIGAVHKDYPSISLAEYEAYTYDKRLGGWKALHYLVEKGLAADLRDAMRFYPEYGIGYENSGFPSISEVCRRIKAAGGYAVLAHPGVTIKAPDTTAFSNELHRIAAMGIDGIECYYPTHSDEITQICLDVCAERNLMITAGSDCHGSFGKTRVGELCIPVENVSLVVSS